MIKNLIVHKLLSDQYDSTVTYNIRDKENPLPDAKADSLLSSILASYRRDGFIAYAGFDETAWFPTELRKVIASHSPFYDFTVASLENIKQHMTQVHAATGGYLTYIYYDDGDDDYFMVILLKDNKGIGITNELDLENIQILTLSELHFAARIDINRWLSDNTELKRNHISFLKGKSREDTVVKYFKSFLGIDENLYLDPSRHTEDFVTSVKNFSTKFVDEAERDGVIDRIFSYATAKKKDNQYIKQTEVASLIYPKEPTAFIDYLHENQIEIPGEFLPVEKILKKLTTFRITTKYYYLRFDRKAIEEQIIWLNDKGHLVIKLIPEDIKRQLPGFK